MKTITAPGKLTDADKASFFPAILRAHSVNGPLDVCLRHAKKLSSIYEVMGHLVVYGPIPQDSKTWCTSCEIEHARQEKTQQ